MININSRFLIIVVLFIWGTILGAFAMSLIQDLKIKNSATNAGTNPCHEIKSKK